MAIDPTDLESYYLERVNEVRADAGVSPLSFDPELMNAAADHNAWSDEHDSRSHTGVNGSTEQTRIRDAGYDAAEPWLAEENMSVFWSRATRDAVEESLNFFMNSPEHKPTLLHPDYRDIGISVIEGDYQGKPAVWVTHTFGAPSAAEAAENGRPATGGPGDIRTSDIVGLTRTGGLDTRPGGFDPSVFENPNIEYVDEELDYGDCLTCLHPVYVDEELDYGDCLTCTDPD